MSTITEPIPVNQEGDADCFAACVATVLGVDYAEIPDALKRGFSGSGDEAWQELAARRGLVMRKSGTYGPKHVRHWIGLVDQRYLLHRSERHNGSAPFATHCVVFEGPELFHDPDPPDRVPGRELIDPTPAHLGQIFEAIWFEPAGTPPVSLGEGWPLKGTQHGAAVAHGRIRKPPAGSTAGTSIDAFDGFDDHAAGPLTGLTAPLGGDHVGAGDGTDFQVDADNGWVERTANGDASVTQGRYIRLGAMAPANVSVQGDVRWELAANTEGDEFRTGVFARFLDPSNWLMAVMRLVITGFGSSRYLRLYKRVGGGAVTELDSALLGLVVSPVFDWRAIKLAADEEGNVVVFEGPQGGSLAEKLGVSEDADLAAGGALDTGGFGIYDVCTAASGVNTRLVDNLVVSTPLEAEVLIDHVLFPARRAKLLHNTALRENEAGTRFGRVPVPEGQYLRIPPSTRAGRRSRIVIVERELDIASGQPSRGLENELGGELEVTPRVTLTGEGS